VAEQSLRFASGGAACPKRGACDDEMMTEDPAPDIVVIGAGVIGLSTGVCLAERGQRVEVRTQRPPTQTTSAVASAMIGPAMARAGEQAGRRERASIAEFTALAQVPGTGVTIRRGRLASREPLPAPGGTSPCAPDEVPPGFAAASWATLPLVDMPVYLEYLAGRLTAAGGRIELRTVTSLPELAAEAPLIVNCAGLGARALAADDSLTPSAVNTSSWTTPGLRSSSSRLPSRRRGRPTGRTPITSCSGGTQSTDDTSAEPDPQVAQDILRRCIEIEPRLGDARVRGHQVGLRPARPTVRLEIEQIGGARCVHNYGHGGSGVTLSWGSAFTAANLLFDQ